MEQSFPRIQVNTKKLLQTPSSAQMQTIVKLLRKMQSNYWKGYIPPSFLGFGTPGYQRLATAAIFSRKELRRPGAMTWKRVLQICSLVTLFGGILQLQ